MSREVKNFNKSGDKKFGVGDYQGAIDDYSKAIELEPKDLQTFIARAQAKYYSNITFLKESKTLWKTNEINIW